MRKEIASLRDVFQSNQGFLEESMWAIRSRYEKPWVHRIVLEADLGTLKDLSHRYIASGCRLAEVEIWDILRDVVRGLGDQIIANSESHSITPGKDIYHVPMMGQHSRIEFPSQTHLARNELQMHRKRPAKFDWTRIPVVYPTRLDTRQRIQAIFRRRPSGKSWNGVKWVLERQVRVIIP